MPQRALEEARCGDPTNATDAGGSCCAVVKEEPGASGKKCGSQDSLKLRNKN